MTNRSVIVHYVSDYTGERRHAVKVDGLYPPELDFDTADQAEAARLGFHAAATAVIESIENDAREEIARAAKARDYAALDRAWAKLDWGRGR